jgi:cellobiose phosphorylase
MITGQVSTGGAMPVVNKINHKPGKEIPPKEEQYRSDDCLWLFNTIPAYVKETGDIDFYSKILPYADQGEDSVLATCGGLYNLTSTGVETMDCHAGFQPTGTIVYGSVTTGKQSSLLCN